MELWALDEVHFQQYGSRCRMWVPPETRDPVLLHHPTRRAVGYYGAVRLRGGRFVFRRESERFNAATFWAFLKQLRRLTRQGPRRAILIVDNASYHHAVLHQSWRTKHANDFSLDFLPPYSPDLNPIERLWKLTRRRCLHNRYFPALEDVIHDVEAQFALWSKRNPTLCRLCAIT